MTVTAPAPRSATAAAAAAPDVVTPTDATEVDERTSLRGLWPFAGLVAGVAAFAGTTLTSRFLDGEVTSGGTAAVVAAVAEDGVRTHLGVIGLFVAVLALIPFAAGFLRFLASRAPRESLTVPVARLGFTAAVATMITAASLKAVYRGGLPGHMDSEMYTPTDVGVIRILVDQFQWVGYWGLVAVMAATVVLAFRARVLPRWFGALSAVLATFVLGMTLVLGLPYSAGLVGPVWLVAAAICVLVTRRRLGRA